MKEAGDIVGEAAPLDLFAAHAKTPVETIYDIMRRHVITHAGPQPQRDDQSFLFIRRSLEPTT